MLRQSDTPASVEFGHFSIFPHRRQLFADGRPIALGGRAFDVLLALIEASGAVVSKDELLKQVWQGRIVEENRLAGEVAALRKAFGADRELIRTIAGRGYQFTGEIRLRPTGAGRQEVPGAATAVIASSTTPVSPGFPRPDELPIAVSPSQNVNGDLEQQGTADQELENIARSVRILHIGLEPVGEAAKAAALISNSFFETVKFSFAGRIIDVARRAIEDCLTHDSDLEIVTPIWSAMVSTGIEVVFTDNFGFRPIGVFREAYTGYLNSLYAVNAAAGEVIEDVSPFKIN